MKKLSHLIHLPSTRTDIFENYCVDKKIIVPSEADEQKYLEQKFLNFDTFTIPFVYYRRYYNTIYEKLTSSTTAEILAKDIEQIIEVDCFINDEDNYGKIIWFSCKDTSLEKNSNFVSVLKRHNWFLLLKRKLSDDYKNNTITYFLEPRKPSNKEDYIYRNCQGLIYKVIDKRRLNKILKYGLNPRIDLKIKSDENYIVPELDSDDYRTYFIAEPNERKLKRALKETLKQLQNSEFGVHSDGSKVEYCIIEINLNTFAEFHHIIIHAYEDPRHGSPSFWTAEFLPGSCIKDVSERFLN